MSSFDAARLDAIKRLYGSADPATLGATAVTLALEVETLRARVAELEAERDDLRARSETWQSEAESWQRSHGLRVAELAEVRAHLRRSEDDYARMCVTVDDAASDAAEAMRERAARWHDERGRVARHTVTMRRHAAHAAAIRALPLTDDTREDGGSDGE